MPIQVFGAPAAVVMLNRAFTDTAPGNLIYQNQVAAATSNLTQFANDFAAGFASLSNAALANLVLGNLGLLPNTALADALAAYYAANGAANRGLVTLQLGQVLAAKEGDATYGAAATAWNDEVASGFNYSANPANTATSGSGSSSAGQTFTLTTGIDIRTGTSGSDTFDGSVNANGTATLTSVDQLNGGDGADQLIAGLGGGTIAPRLQNIETAEFIATAASAFDLINTTGLNTLLARNSGAALTLNNIGSTTAPAITVQDQSADLNLNFANAALAGASSLTLTLNGAQSDGSGGAAVAIAQQAGADTTGLESLTLASNGSGANFLDAVTATNAAGTSTVTSLTVTGAQGLTVQNAFNATVRTVDAAAMTGATGLSASFNATAAVTVTGSGGNDTLTFAANAGDSTISAGAGNDTITIANFTTADSINGGDGAADRLNISAANAEAIAAALTNTVGFEQLSLNTAGTAASAINATRFGTIDTVRLDAGTAGGYGVTMKEGTVTLGIGNLGAGALGGALTVTDTGTASTDVLNLTNRVTTAAVNAFAAQAITSAGYETVNLSTGANTTAGAQTTGVITLNNDVLSAANTLMISGANSLTVNRVDSNSSGLLTIDASGLTGTSTFTMTLAPTFTVATGTAKITGTANADTLQGFAATPTTLVGGAGNDTINGGTGADNIAGDAGNDSLTGGGGNDVVTGGDGNDIIDMTTAAGAINVSGGAGNDTVSLANFLTATDTVDGGDGTDTLSITAAATAATATGVSNFETLTLGAALGGQGMEQFTANSTFTRINYGAFNNAVTNAAAAIATLGFANGAGTTSMARLVDTSTNAVTLQGTNTVTGAVGVTALTINDEETVTVNTGTAAIASNITITTLSANDLVTLTVSGAGTFEVTNAIAGSSLLATINATGNTATVNVNASSSTANGTFTGSFVAANTITGGTGADTITGGTAADSLTGGNGGDVINGGAGADILLGGLGADSISGEIGNDTITGGVGNDTLVGGDGADDFVFEGTANGVDTITGFVSGTDNLNVTTNVVGGGGGVTTIAAAAAATGASIFAADNQLFFLSFNGAAANLTTGGTATLSAADMTATTLTNLAAYLGAHFNAASGADTNDVVVLVNWTAGGSTTSYLYEAVNNNAADALTAAELTLIGVIDRGTTVLSNANTDLI